MALDLNFLGRNTRYATHGLRSYAAKCPPQLVEFCLDEYSKKGDLVLDQMAGSGTTLAEAIQDARHVYEQRGGALTVVASVCGTNADPQDLNLQVNMLQETGCPVYSSNARATAACARLLEKE